MPVKPTALLVVLIVALTSLGPLSTDFYLPALPAIARALHTDSAGAQLTLSVYLLGFGAGQLILGPFSDRFGRRPVLLWSMLVFVLASVACALAQSIEALIAARFLQALGACGGPVLGRAVVRDLYGPKDAGRVLSHVATGTALAPLLAPLLGGLLTAHFGWRSSFVALTVYSIVLLVVIARQLQETNRHLDPHAMHPLRMLSNYRTLLADRVYRGACSPAAVRLRRCSPSFPARPSFLSNCTVCRRSRWAWLSVPTSPASCSAACYRPGCRARSEPSA